MTKKEFEKIAAILRSYYRDKTFTSTVAAVYWEEWRKYPYSTVYRAVMDAVKNLDSNQVPSLKAYEPFIEKYRTRLGPLKYPPDVQKILDEDSRERPELPYEVRRWNINSLKVVIDAIREKKRIGVDQSEVEFLSRYAERFVRLWLERQELGKHYDLNSMEVVQLSTYLEVIGKIHPELVTLVVETLELEAKHEN